MYITVHKHAATFFIAFLINFSFDGIKNKLYFLHISLIFLLISKNLIIDTFNGICHFLSYVVRQRCNYAVITLNAKLCTLTFAINLAPLIEGVGRSFVKRSIKFGAKTSATKLFKYSH